MTIYIIARRMEGGSSHQHIAWVQWAYAGTTTRDFMSRAQAVEWIDQGGDARVNGYPSSRVGTVAGFPKYLRAQANGYLNDNLLSLPTF